MSQQAEERDPFEKVFLVARIASLETAIKAQEEALRAKEEAIQQMAQRLRQHAKMINSAMAMPLEKVLAFFTNVGPWLSEADRETWERLLAVPAFAQALKAQSLALIVEVVSGADQATAD